MLSDATAKGLSEMVPDWKSTRPPDWKAVRAPHWWYKPTPDWNSEAARGGWPDESSSLA
jgi:hypothetical protein